MFLIYNDANGRRHEALILVLEPQSMRIAVRDRNETIELRREGDVWVGEDGSPVSIEAMFASVHQEGLQTNTQNSAVADTTKTTTAAMTSTANGFAF